MNKQEFIDLGLSEDLATKAEVASKKELESYIPKTRFDEVNTAKKNAEEQIKTLTTDLETAKKNAGDNEDLKKQLETAIQKQKDDAKKYADDMKELQLNNAIKLSLAGKIQDGAEDFVLSKFDKSKLILGEDGKVTGLDEQLKAIQTANVFAFKQETDPNQQQRQPGFKIGGQQQQKQQNPGSVSLKDALAAKFAQQQAQ